MGSVRVALTHACSKEEARKCCSDWFDELSRTWEHKLGEKRMQWDGDQASFKIVMITSLGDVPVEGTLTVSGADVELQGKYSVPFLLRAFAGGIEGKIESLVKDHWLEHCRACTARKPD